MNDSHLNRSYPYCPRRSFGTVVFLYKKMPPFMNFITTVALSVQLIFLSHGVPHRCTLISYKVSISLSRSHLMRSIIFISHAPFCLISLPGLIRKLQMHVDFVQSLHIVVAQPFNAVDHLHKSCSFQFSGSLIY